MHRLGGVRSCPSLGYHILIYKVTFIVNAYIQRIPSAKLHLPEKNLLLYYSEIWRYQLRLRDDRKSNYIVNKQRSKPEKSGV